MLRGGQSFSVQNLELLCRLIIQNLELLFRLMILGNRNFPITPLKGKKKQSMLLYLMHPSVAYFSLGRFMLVHSQLYIYIFFS